MMRALFFREYRSGLALDVVVSLSFVAIFAVPALKAQLASPIAILILTFLAPIMATLGFAAGERCFSSTFKETSLFLMNGLPIARSQVWWAITSARFLASLAGLGLSAGSLALVARKANFAISPGIEVYATIFLVFLASYFFGGICSLLVRRTLAVYCLGLSATELVFSALRHANPGYIDPIDSLNTFDAYFFSRYWLGELCLLAVMACSLSVHIFNRFELASARRRIMNLTVLLVSLLIYSGIVVVMVRAEGHSSQPGIDQPAAKAFSEGVAHVYEATMR